MTGAKPSVSLVLVALATFLAVVFGGQIPTDTQALLPGQSALLAALSGGPEVPTLTIALLSLMVAIGLVLHLARSAVLQVPPYRMTILFGAFIATLLFSVLLSAFRAVSLVALVPWLSYALLFFAIIGTVGRKQGPLWIIGAVFAGSGVVALRGIIEYSEMKAIDPTWRIFAGWVNPNATAVVLMIGLLCGLGLVSRLQRPVNLLVVSGTVLIGLALLLTQSKGAIIATGIGLVAFCVFALIFTGKSALKPVGSTAGLVALLFVFAFGLSQASAPKAGVSGSSAVSRFTNAGSTQEQSSGFRILLWRGAINLVKKNPIGYGIGTYRYESARPGLTTQTILTHSSPLQLAAEASPFSPILLVFLLGFWLRSVAKGTRAQPEPTGILKASIVAATFAIFAHSWVDSDLHYFGIGFAFFGLLAVGLLLSADAVSPEHLPTNFRVPIAVVALVPGLFGLYLGAGEALRAESRGLAMTGDPAGAFQRANAAVGLLGIDGEAYALAGRNSESSTEAISNLRRAADLSPTTRNLRALARYQEANGEENDAVVTLLKALFRDPYNLPTLSLLWQVQRKTGAVDQAQATAERLLTVEKKPYFLIRSLPDVIPTETYEAREFLAQIAGSSEKRIRLLSEAVAGFREYAGRTVPQVLGSVGADGKGSYADEDLASVKRKMELAAKLAEELARLYRAEGKAAEGDTAADDAAAFRAILSK
jgi:O-antigen ligase